MTLYQQVFANNQKWIRENEASNKDFFYNLSKGQQPEFLYIGCSDSRVTPEQMAGVGPGDFFVHRNVANIVSNIDLNILSVIEYAVAYLRVKHIVVCGHYMCGGVKAAMSPADMGIMNPWLKHVRDVYRTHQQELEAIEDEKKQYDRLVELNVQEQAINVMNLSVVQKAVAERGGPEVHGWVFDIRTGKLIDLDINFKEEVSGFERLYHLDQN